MLRSSPSQRQQIEAFLGREHVSLVKHIREAGLGAFQGKLSDSLPLCQGAFSMLRVYTDGSDRVEVAVHDKNLIVSLGRRVTTRAIAGAQGSPVQILRGTTPALRIVRGTSGAPSSAWVSFTQAAGSNTYTLSGYTSAAPSVPEWSIPFTGGTTSLAALVANINSQANWFANVIGSNGTIDAAQLLQVNKALCLGTSASYASGFTSPHAARLPALVSVTDTITTGLMTPLRIARLRFGIEGARTDDDTKGKDVLTTDERLSSPLRPADLGFTQESQDYIACSVSYPQPANQVTFTAILDGTQANGQYISEAALFTDVATIAGNPIGDYMFARKNFGKVLKNELFELWVIWTIIA